MENMFPKFELVPIITYFMILAKVRRPSRTPFTSTSRSFLRRMLDAASLATSTAPSTETPTSATCSEGASQPNSPDLQLPTGLVWPAPRRGHRSSAKPESSPTPCVRRVGGISLAPAASSNRCRFAGPGNDLDRPSGSVSSRTCTSHSVHKSIPSVSATTLPTGQKPPFSGFLRDRLERVAGIEPAYSAWKAAALPLSYTRGQSSGEVVERAGFEPA